MNPYCLTPEELERARRLAFDTKLISDSTVEAYMKDAARLFENRAFVGCRATRQRLQAAWYFLNRNELRARLLDLDGAGPGERILHSSAIRVHLKALVECNPEHDGGIPGHAPDTTRHQPTLLPRQDGKGKRKGLGSLPGDWREQLLQAAPEKLRGELTVLALTGCRLSELDRGIEMEMHMIDEEPYIAFKINGTKLSEYNGHPQRVLLFPVDHWLAQPLSERLQRVFVCERERMQRTILQLAEQFPGPYVVSAMSFRHQFAADLKAVHAPRKLLAQAMGHRSTRTAEGYGHIRQGRRGKMCLPSHVLTQTAIREFRIPKKAARRVMVTAPGLG